MSWIESHQSLLTHRKTLRAAALLKIDRLKLIGHLHALWWWALDNAEDNGDLGQTLHAEVAEAACWPVRRADEFVKALVEVHFLDTTDGGVTLTLHNWWKYAGKLNEKRAKDRERKTEVARNSTGIPSEVAGKSQAPTNQPPPTNPPDQPTNQPGGAARPNIFSLVMDFFGPGAVSSRNADDLLIFEQEHPPECVEHCFERARLVMPRPKSFGYIKAMAERHRREGCDGKPSGAGGVKPGKGADSNGMADHPVGVDERLAAQLHARRNRTS